MLTQLADNVFVAAAPLTVVAFRIGTRMTVIRQSDGRLWVHSPITLNPELKSEIDALGEVADIVAPNAYHHLYAGDFKAAYPDAKLHGVRALQKKRKDLAFDSILDDQHSGWSDSLIPIPIDGTILKEVVFYHPESKTLVSCDLVENFESSDHWLTRMYLRAGGIEGRVGLHKLLQKVAIRDHSAVRRSIDQVLEHEIERIVVSHGDVIENDVPQAIETTYTFLKA